MATKVTDDGRVESGDLKNALRKHVAETGSISSATVARVLQEGKPDDRPTGAALNEDTPVESKRDGLDPLVSRADQSPPASVPATAVVDNPTTTTTELEKLLGRAKTAKVVIKAETKQAFIAALIANERFVLPYSLCGGRLQIKIQSRLVPESQAIVAEQRREIERKQIVTNLDYATRARAMLMTAQVLEVNGTRYPGMLTPYYWTANPVPPTPSGPPAAPSETPPGWLDWIDFWAKQHEGLFAVLWACIQDFEDQYWQMIDGANNQDFWFPAASTSA